MNIPGVTYSHNKKRILAAFLNLVIYLIMAFLVDYWVSPFTYKKWTNYESYNNEYDQVIERYYELQDDYGLASYDSEGNRYIVSSVSEEVTINFRNDEEVKYLLEKENSLQKTLIGINISSFVISFAFTSLLLTIGTSICFGKYLSIGYALTGQKEIEENGDVPTTGKRVLFALSRWALLYPLGICSILMIPVSFLYQICYEDNSQTKLEKKFKLLCVIRSDL